MPDTLTPPTRMHKARKNYASGISLQAFLQGAALLQEIVRIRDHLIEDPASLKTLDAEKALATGLGFLSVGTDFLTAAVYDGSEPAAVRKALQGLQATLDTLNSFVDEDLKAVLEVQKDLDLDDMVKTGLVPPGSKIEILSAEKVRVGTKVVERNPYGDCTYFSGFTFLCQSRGLVVCASSSSRPGNNRLEMNPRVAAYIDRYQPSYLHPRQQFLWQMHGCEGLVDGALGGDDITMQSDDKAVEELNCGVYVGALYNSDDTVTLTRHRDADRFPEATAKLEQRLISLIRERCEDIVIITDSDKGE